MKFKTERFQIFYPVYNISNIAPKILDAIKI